MKLVWKLLRQHISLPQFAGFFFANLLGMLVVLLGIQLYFDILPIFTQGDSFIKNDYLIVSKRISSLGSLTGANNTFTQQDIEELAAQSFSKKVGQFTASRFKVTASIGLDQSSSMSTEMFFEAVPNDFIDSQLDQWVFNENTQEIPIILPRNYLALYNFGFAQTRGLPKISEGLVSMISLGINIRGNGLNEAYKGRVVGFSNRLNTILVPQDFIQWANVRYSDQTASQPSRLIMEVYNPTDDRIARYLQQKKYEVENDKMDAGKATYFLKLITAIVLVIGVLISLLSFYILMLSIYLLLQKNSTKLENLLLIGYSPNKVARPYQILTIALNLSVALLAFVMLYFIRQEYLKVIIELFPTLNVGTVWPAMATITVLLLLVSAINMISIKRKVASIWSRRRVKRE